MDLSAYEVVNLSILSSSSIQQRTTRILTLLQRAGSPGGGVATDINTNTTTGAAAIIAGESEGGKEEREGIETRPCIVRLHASAKAASKLISVVEIVKRELLRTCRMSCFQYSAVEGVMKEQQQQAMVKEGVKKKQKKNKEGGVEDGEGADENGNENEAEGEIEEEENEGFEMMKTPFERSIEGVKKVRAVPMLMVWLSRERVEGLARKFGEQSNGVEISR